MPLKVREGGPKDPIGAKCRLGWSIYGYIPNQPIREAVLNFHVAAPTDCDLEMNEQLRDYFALENVGVNAAYERLEFKDDLRANLILRDTQDEHDGTRYETALLWKHDNLDFPDPMVVRCLKHLDRKFKRGTGVSRTSS